MACGKKIELVDLCCGTMNKQKTKGWFSSSGDVITRNLSEREKAIHAYGDLISKNCSQYASSKMKSYVIFCKFEEILSRKTLIRCIFSLTKIVEKQAKHEITKTTFSVLHDRCTILDLIMLDRLYALYEK